MKAGKAATRRRLIAKLVRCQNSVVEELAVLVAKVVSMGRGRRAEIRARELATAAMAPVGSGMRGGQATTGGIDPRCCWESSLEAKDGVNGG